MAHRTPSCWRSSPNAARKSPRSLSINGHCRRICAPFAKLCISIANGSVDVVLFMTAVQVIHLFQVAEEMGLRDELSAGLRSVVVVSIGPTTSEELAHYGITPDFEPSRPKMGFHRQRGCAVCRQDPGAEEAAACRSHGAGRSGHGRAAVEKEESKRASRGAPRRPIHSNHGGFSRRPDAPLIFCTRSAAELPQPTRFMWCWASIVEFVTTVIPCDSCFIYVLEQGQAGAARLKESSCRPGGPPRGSAWARNHRMGGGTSRACCHRVQCLQRSSLHDLPKPSGRPL